MGVCAVHAATLPCHHPLVLLVGTGRDLGVAPGQLSRAGAVALPSPRAPAAQHDESRHPLFWQLVLALLIVAFTLNFIWWLAVSLLLLHEVVHMWCKAQG